MTLLYTVPLLPLPNRYEELERQLLEAQAIAEAKEEEVELARAREAVARLTAPEPLAQASLDGAAGGSSSSGSSALSGAGGAAVAAGAVAAAAGRVAAGGGVLPPEGGAAVAAGHGDGGNGGRAGAGGGGVGAQVGVAGGAVPGSPVSSIDEVALEMATQQVGGR